MSEEQEAELNTENFSIESAVQVLNNFLNFIWILTDKNQSAQSRIISEFKSLIQNKEEILQNFISEQNKALYGAFPLNGNQVNLSPESQADLDNALK